MKNLLIYLLFAFVLFLGFSCREEENLNNEIILEDFPIDTVVLNNSIYLFTLQVKAEDGLSSLKLSMDRTLEKTFDVKGQKSFTIQVEVPIQKDASLLNRGVPGYDFYISVFAKDQNGDILQRQFKLLVISDLKDLEPSQIEMNPEDFVVIEEDINRNFVWETGKVYLLKGRISVLPPATLTIQPGTIIKASSSSEEISSLVIMKGAKIKAVGLPNSPIIFTSEFDPIKPSDRGLGTQLPFFPFGYWDRYTIKNNPNLKGPEGWWGGLVILGNAPGSFPNDQSETNLTELPSNFTYGGSDEWDNSGALKYVSIRYAGTRKSNGSLTLAGVGANTTLEQIEISGSAGDGVKIFGGSASIKNLIANEIDGNGFLISQGWKGSLDNFLLLYLRDQAFKITGPSISRFSGNHQIKKGSVLAFPSKGLVSLSSNSNTELSSIFFYEVSDFLEHGIDQISNSFQPKVESIEFHIPRIQGFDDDWGWGSGESYYPEFIFTNYFSKWDPKLVKQVDLKGFSVGPYLAPFKDWSIVFQPYQLSNTYPPGF